MCAKCAGAAKGAPLFELGDTVVSSGVMAWTEEDPKSKRTVDLAFRRHVTGDWSEMPREDAVSNFSAALNGGRVFSSYDLEDGRRLWVITEDDRSVTTVLFPEEY